METYGTAIESYDQGDFPKMASLYDEDALLIEYIATGRPVRTDYGVPGSPVWYEIEDIAIIIIDVNCVSYTPKELEAKFGTELADEIIDYCSDAAYQKDWDV
jgi:hypothetical protein